MVIGQGDLRKTIFILVVFSQVSSSRVLLSTVSSTNELYSDLSSLNTLNSAVVFDELILIPNYSDKVDSFTSIVVPLAWIAVAYVISVILVW